ncbi:receptor-like protein kinase [Dorcoceras hygrometricum]|uniref:non-specific serine/threonine protein kinase n=1 Tax=Dorcoceras hygrometricum TaxID=472368 RepID=A0A2Z7DBE0_9LAMI|nr:receptor-like protein kinase [Dorcoceras hygrometricum]
MAISDSVYKDIHSMVLMLFCLFLCLYLAGTPAACLSNETDFSALLAFKKAVVDDDPLGALRSWNGTVNFCEWEGILCSQRNRGRVVSINLRSQGLVGSLPPHLGNLSFLREFILQNNSFYGEIPEEFGRLRRLEFVEFSNNSFSGEIPRNLSQCRNLYYLNLIDNELTGIIIPELGSMFKLEALGLTTNNLAGTIPSFIGNLTSLTRLSLSNCGLEGEIPESLVRLRRLRFINLSNNKLTGEVPYGLYNISNITVFSMGFNGLHGKIPPDIGFTLPKLRVFDLGGNDFDGPIPASLSNASFLESVYLFFNNFTGQMIKDFHRLSALEELLLQYNSLEGDINLIASLKNSTNLVSLDVSSNLLRGLLPDSIANLSSQLSQLYIGQNQIHGTIPEGIENLIGLTVLDFHDNSLQGPIPWGLGKLRQLQEINMGANILTNEIPSSLGNLTLLNRMSLKENFLYGEIPQSLSNWKNLLSLDLSSNNLNGSIPRDVISLLSISILFNLSHNAFTGPIPVEVGSLINLKELDLSHNRLSGPIPTTLSRCVVLERLHLEGNSLAGEIPAGFSALKGLQELDLSQNNLSGSIPSFLVNELNLISLNLSFNRLQGEVPTKGVFKNESAISLEGNANLCGGIALLELPPCPPTNFKKKHFPNLWKILISVLGAGSICLTLSICIYILVYRRRIKLKEAQYLVSSLPESFLRLSYADLVKATDGFSEANLLGSGRFGSVYKGTLDENQVSVAVKVLNLETKGASKSFISECNAIKGIRHRNLLQILSVCQSTDAQGNDFKALVYEFMANGSLDKWLHHDYAKDENAGGENLSIAQRLNIAIDVANAVEYLHNGTDSIIVHGDLKPGNILLDHHLTAHVGDFGLAKVISNICPPNDTSTNSSAIKGTIGYIPPEYGMTSDISTQGDIYSYGILLLEIITRIRPTDDAALSGGRSSLHDLVSHALQSQEIDQIIPREHTIHMNSMNKNVCMSSILEIGVACSKESSKHRMQMNDVVRKLHAPDIYH